MTSVIIPGSVTSIGAEAFEGCENLTPESATSIGRWFASHRFDVGLEQVYLILIVTLGISVAFALHGENKINSPLASHEIKKNSPHILYGMDTTAEYTFELTWPQLRSGLHDGVRNSLNSSTRASPKTL